jgi:hypothetical protein
MDAISDNDDSLLLLVFCNDFDYFTSLNFISFRFESLLTEWH